MIQLRNTKEFLIEWFKNPVIAANVPTANTNGLVGYQPTASGILDVLAAPFDLTVRGLVLAIGTVGAAGNSVTLKCAYRIRNGGNDLSGTTILTKDGIALDLSATPTVIPVAGTRILAPSVDQPPIIPIGSLIHMHYNETGTLGTATRPIVNPVGLIVRAVNSIDPRDIAYKH